MAKKIRPTATVPVDSTTPQSVANAPGETQIAPTPAARKRRYVTPADGAKPFAVTRTDCPNVVLRDSFVDESEAIRCFILEHGPGGAGSKYTVVADPEPTT